MKWKMLSLPVSVSVDWPKVEGQKGGRAERKIERLRLRRRLRMDMFLKRFNLGNGIMQFKSKGEK